MKYAIYNGVLISVEQLRNEINKSGDYKCPGCRNPMTYVRESVTGRTAHFRHLNLVCYLENERASGYENKMSEFHFQWQSIFPSECLELPIGNHRADILVKLSDRVDMWKKLSERLFRNFLPENLVIEIQHSPISVEDLQSRQDTYVNRDESRELLWIFDLQACRYEVRHVKTYATEKYYLKILDNSSFVRLFQLVGLYKPLILLDMGCDDLYLVTDNSSQETGCMEILPVKRQDFLRFLGYKTFLNLEWNYPILPMIEIDEFDYVHLISSLPSGLDVKGLTECFHMMELLSFEHFLMNSVWKNRPGFLCVGHNLGRLSNGHDLVRDIWIRWIQRHRVLLSDIVPFGDYRGDNILSLSKRQREWLSKRNLNRHEGLKKKLMMLSYCDDPERLTSEFNSPTSETSNGSLIYLCRKIFKNEKWRLPRIPKPE